MDTSQVDKITVVQQPPSIILRADQHKNRRNSVFTTFDNASHFTTASHKNNNFSLEPKLKSIIAASKETDHDSIRYSNMLVLPPIEATKLVPMKKKRTSVLQIISKNQGNSHERSSLSLSDDGEDDSIYYSKK
jgi:hypothetical protein